MDPRTTRRLQSASLVRLREVVEQSNRVRHALSRRAGLSASELDALQHLMSTTEGQYLGPADLSRRLDVTTAATTAIVDRLVARGHVVREPDPTDRRRTRLLVSDSGQTEVVHHLTPMFSGLVTWDEQFTSEERSVVERYLAGVREVLAGVAAGSPDPSPRVDESSA